MKLPPTSVERYRGKSALLVTRKRSDEANRARARRILAKQPELSLHALGAAIPRAIALAARLVDESGGALVAHATTGTEWCSAAMAMGCAPAVAISWTVYDGVKSLCGD